MKRNLWVMGLIAVLVIMAGCKKDKSADIADLLKTIPADASMVMVMDVESILEEMDCTVKDGQIKPGKELTKALDNSKNGDFRKTLEELNNSGIDWTAAALFAEGYNIYLTGYLNDSDKFKAAVEKRFGDKWESGEVATCGNTAIDSDRFWTCLTSRNTIVPNDIRHFITLSENQSILSNKVAAKLKDNGADIAGWGDISGVLNMTEADFSTKAGVKLALAAMFVDAVELQWEMDFDGAELKTEIEVINNKGGIAKFKFPVEKVNADVVKDLNVNAVGFGAVAISKKMIEQIKAETSTESFSLIGAFVNMMLGCVDGTSALAVGAGGNVQGVITTNGHGTTDFIDALKQFGLNVGKEGNALRVSAGDGEISGPLSSADAADMLKGSVMGFVYGGYADLENLETVAFTFHADKGGLKGEIVAKGKGTKKKFLLNFFK